jgi:uncharacterized OB-fold protein
MADDKPKQAKPTGAEDPDKPVRFMRQMVSLDYVATQSPLAARYGAALAERRISGQKCPECGLVYVPLRGFCPLCVAEMTEDDEIDVSDHGTITTFTIITPIQYRGQEEREDYTLASILLDGADQTIGQQRLGAIDNTKVKAGVRVKAVWNDDLSGASGGAGGAIECWEPSGEPDVDPTEFEEHMS